MLCRLNSHLSRPPYALPSCLIHITLTNFHLGVQLKRMWEDVLHDHEVTKARFSYAVGDELQRGTMVRVCVSL